MKFLRYASFRQVMFTGAAFASLMLIIGALAALKLRAGLPDIEQLKQYDPRLTSRILDRNGLQLGELYTQRRLIVPLDSLPDHTTGAILVIEDNRFFQHWGMDLIRVCRAALVDITTFSLKQGASTITQQLARDLYLHKRRTFTRKLKETITAIQIERHYSKHEILEMYLTQIYFGHGAYGIQAAADKYFDKPAHDLLPSESALLAALPKAPALYSPFLNPERALNRRNLVLRMMRERDVISDDEYHIALDTPLPTAGDSPQNQSNIAGYFTEMVRQQLSSAGAKLGFQYLTDGLMVHTTLDARLQAFARAAVDWHMASFQSEYRRRFVKRTAEQIAAELYHIPIDSDAFPAVDIERIIADSARIDSLFSRRAVVQVALVALDPESGDILALIGGRDFEQSKFNRAIQARRQPGSVFKPIAYTAAIDNGYPTTYQLLNQDVVLTMPDGARWVPGNYDGSHGGPTTLREAMRRSLNLVTVRLVQEVVPPQTVVQYARQLGITTRIAAVDAVALGASGIIPIEATAAFSVFAAGGVNHEPRAIISIDDRFGERIVEYPVKRRVALSSETAYIMTDMLKTVINRGTGGGARWKHHFTPNAAGKTGTTNDFTDAWFIGFTPRIVCGVWVGLDDPAESLGPGQSGAVAALPIWASFMKMAYDSLGIPDEEFARPAGVVNVVICDHTKQIATPYCPLKVTELFRQDTVPLANCRIHKRAAGL